MYHEKAYRDALLTKNYRKPDDSIVSGAVKIASGRDMIMRKASLLLLSTIILLLCSCRGGVAEPIVADAATAERLARQVYGDEDSDTGFLYSYIFEEMFVHEGLSCYKIRLQWLVDDNHWSTIDFIGVTPDGHVFSIQFG